MKGGDRPTQRAVIFLGEEPPLSLIISGQSTLRSFKLTFCFLLISLYLFSTSVIWSPSVFIPIDTSSNRKSMRIGFIILNTNSRLPYRIRDWLLPHRLPP